MFFIMISATYFEILARVTYLKSERNQVFFCTNCPSYIEKNTPKLKFGTNVDMEVLNLNPRICIEIILMSFYKIQDGGQDGRQIHFDTYISSLLVWLQ